MTADTTASMRPPMDCDQVTREEVAQRYLLGSLGEDDREAFERHYFDCERCLEELQMLEGVRDELVRAPERERPIRQRLRIWLPAAAVAAVLVLAVTAILRKSEEPATPSPVTGRPAETL